MTVGAIPDDILALAQATGLGAYVRGDVAAAQAAMRKLGIPVGTQFYVFASMYILGNLVSPHDAEAMVDVSAPTEEVLLGTTFAREVWELPEQYVCFTSCQGEGGYLISTVTGEVFDFSLAEREQFLRDPGPQWTDFFSFLRWYLSPPRNSNAD